MLILSDSGVDAVCSVLARKHGGKDGLSDKVFGSPDGHEEAWHREVWAASVSGAPDLWREVLLDEELLPNPISRLHLKQLAVDVSTDRRRAALLSGVMAWGAGTRSWIWPSRLNKLAQRESTLRRVEALCALARQESGEAAYAGLWGPSRLAFFKASYGTKLLYFAGHGTPHASLQPLILDRLVAASLYKYGIGPGREGLGSRHNFAWSPKAYADYLDCARDAALRVAERIGVGAVPTDGIEYALFTLAKAPSGSRGCRLES